MRNAMAWAICALMITVAVHAETKSRIRWDDHVVESGGTKTTYPVGHLIVPENHEAPNGRTIDLAFLKLPSTSAHPGDPIVFLVGGPGEPAIRMLGSRASTIATFDDLRELGDVILLDQRGTGMSEPSLFCRWHEPPSPESLLMDKSPVQASWTKRFESCLDRLREKGIDLSAYNTRESAHDIDDLRRALGASRLNLIGFSYGTHLALATIRDHGDHLHRVVLVGTEGPNDTVKLPSTFDTQWRKLSLLAAADPTIGHDVPDLEASLRRVLRRLEKKPIIVEVTDRRAKKKVDVPIDAASLRRIILWDIGDGNDIPYLPALVDQLDHGDTSLLSWYVGKRFNQLAFGMPAMTFAMDCASGATAERLHRVDEEAKTSLWGNWMNAPGDLLCAAIHVPDLGDDYRSPIVSNVETLFVSGTLDSNTPPYQAERVRWGFTRGTHLIVVNAGHEDMLPNPTVHKAIVSFLRDGDPGVTRVVLPAPKFVPVSTKTR